MNIDRVYMNIAEREEKFGWHALTPAERAVTVVMNVWFEVGNGGFRQYYFNLAGRDAADAPEAFRQIGAANLSRVMKEANLLFGEAGPARDRSERQLQLRDIPLAAQEKMQSLDKLVFDDPDLEDRLIEFAAKAGITRQR